ncbi:MAG: AAA family ATPase [Desulfarculus sp.]|nr:AAA family ATPase [Desulfarculus sp.]
MPLDPEVKILGFTGPIGSGGSYFAKKVAEKFGFHIIKLSKYIRQECERRQQNITSQSLQDTGNYLRQQHGNSHLVECAVNEIEQNGASTTIIIDGIRNTAEVSYLRRFTNFYLIAVDATYETRKKRKGNLPDFEIIDKRDKNEELSYGQQVRKCVYLSDIIVKNDTDHNEGSELEREYCDKFIYSTANTLLNPGTRRPLVHETLMTLAYAQSLRSTCLKRKVGAVIATAQGDILSAGYNDVPSSLNSCQVEHGQCFKDTTRISNLIKIIKCPKCGGDINIDVNCPKCNQKYDNYRILCNKRECKTELISSIKCTCCGINIISEFDVKDISRCRALHAEENAIVKLSKIGGGISLKNSIIYVTTFPCKLCANKIREVGITKVVYVEPYPDKDSFDVLRDAVEVEPFYGVKSNAYFKVFGTL